MRNTAGEQPSVTCIHQVFEARARETPDAIAVTCKGQSLSYRQLDTRSNQLARYLVKLGVKLEMPVGIYVERSLDTLVGLLGILKAGGVYVPLDPIYPSERVAFVLDDCQIGLVLTQERLAGRLSEHRARMVQLDGDWLQIARESESDLESGVTPENLAYVIYTSGSTGTPKGVEVTHSSVVHLFEATRSRFGFASTDVWTAPHSYAFDFSVWDIFGPLLSGGRLVVVPLRVTQSPEEFYQLLRDERITILSLTPSALRPLVQLRKKKTTTAADNWSVRLVICGGDAFPSDLVAGLLEWNTPIWNFYGPTESTVWATNKQVGPSDDQYNTVPIGQPIPDIEAYLLDDRLQIVPSGAAGELHLGGAGLARGYCRRQELTAERFVPDPFSGQAGARLYKTGDIGRRLPSGDIEHLGRIDHQVKVRGFRVELEEIENVLSQHQLLQRCIVTVREDQPGEQRLVAYVIPQTGHILKTSELLRLAQSKLPDYMVPGAFVVMEKFPLTRNGKVDRRSLPAPAKTRPDLKEGFVAPQTSTENLLAHMWASVLYIDQIGANDNFFELGGHSLLATKVISRVRDYFGIDLPLSAVFGSPTVAQLATVIDKSNRSHRDMESLSIPAAPRNDHLPLSFPQERVYFIQQLFPETLAYNFQSTLRFRGHLDVDVMERSLNEIVRRHEIYRTTFPAIDGRPVQVIHEPWQVKLDVIALESVPEGERSDAADRLIRDELRKPFDLTRLPLIRWLLFRISEEDHVLLHVEHHLVHDGWSFNVFLNEFLDIYRAFADGRPSPLPDLPVQFADFAIWQRQWMQGQIAKAQLDFWREKLAGSARVLRVLTDRPRPAIQSFRGTSRRVELPLELCESLRRFSREQGATLFMTMLAAFQLLLHRLTEQTNFCVGSGIANRRWPETEGMIGMLVNTIALRADFSGNPSFQELLSRVRKSTLDAYTHQDLPFEILVDALQRDRDLSRNPLFQIMFNFHDAPLSDLDLPGLNVELTEVISNQTSKFDFNVIVIPRSEQRAGSGSQSNESGITVIWEYNTDLFDDATIARFEGYYRILLQTLVANPEQPVAELPLVTASARRQLVKEGQGARTEFPGNSTVQELFEEQVERTPNATAVVFEDETLSFGELNRRANQLAHYLKSRGIGPDMLVGICLERSVEMLVGLLGILKAGGAYVPLDPGYPPQRLALMLEDVSIVVTQERFRESLFHSGVDLIMVDTGYEGIAQASQENPENETAGENLAYVIYTSGSTGKPKGVCVTHRSVLRLVKNTDYSTFSSNEVFLQFAPISFDASTFEIWGSLLNGARLVVMPPGLPSLQELGAALQRHEITTLWLTAGLFQQMVDAQLDSLAGLHQLLAGGDVLSIKHVERVLRELKGCQLINGYGPTENTTFTCCYRAKPGERFTSSVPIGRPISNTDVFILDRRLQLVPAGVAGDLYIGGDGLARGYLKDAERTAEKFIPHPFADEPGRRLYRSGDRARSLQDGTIEFLGRTDNQVKVRGYRIELGEIEVALGRYPGVRECAALNVVDPPEESRLVAYVVLESGASLEVVKLRAFLRKQLPEYMIPSRFIALAQMPLTPNGKIDYRALPTPDRLGSDTKEEFLLPRTPLEQRLSEIWATLLNLDRVGADDNFFELGGHSLLATQVISRIRDTFNVELPLTSLFASPTVAGLSEAVERARAKANEPGAAAIVPIPRNSRRAKVSPRQNR